MRPHFVALIALALTGCSSLEKTPYVTPKLSVPDTWRHATGQTTEATAVKEKQWWRNFNDPALEALIEEVLRRNNDLATAVLAVQRARLQMALSAKSALPQVSASLGASDSRTLGGESNASRSYSASGGLSYEVDLWGKLALQRDVAQWEAQATEQDRKGVELSLIGTTMGLYWRLGYMNQRIAQSAQSIKHAQQALDMARVKYDVGAIALLDVHQAEQAVASQRADLAQQEHQRDETRNTLALLFDGPPGKALTEPQQLPETALPVIDTGLPAHLLSRRPDLQAAELRLRETLANTDVSRMNFYPPLSLSGSLSGSGATLASILSSNPALAFGASVALPFIQWQEMKLNGQIAQADYERAVIGFRQTFYRALAEVENALSQRKQLTEQANYLDKALATASKAERIAEVQYRTGSVPIKVWLDAQEARRSASLSVAANRLDQLTAYVTLYQALGGEATPENTEKN